jgi:uncharacterized protein DUF3617
MLSVPSNQIGIAMHRMTVVVPVAIAALCAADSGVAQPSDSFPPRRPGQWEVRMATEKPVGGPQFVAQMCIDAATDRELMTFGLRMSKDTCKRYELKRAGASWVIDAECTFGPVKSVSHTTISGDFQSTVTVRIEGTTEGMPGAEKGPQPTLITQASRWMGATCNDGMVPGDIALGNGIKFNVKQMKGLEKLLPQIQVR